MTSNIMESGLAATLADSLRTRIHLIRSHRLMSVQVPQVVTNLTVGGALCLWSPSCGASTQDNLNYMLDL